MFFFSKVSVSDLILAMLLLGFRPKFCCKSIPRHDTLKESSDHWLPFKICRKVGRDRVKYWLSINRYMGKSKKLGFFCSFRGTFTKNFLQACYCILTINKWCDLKKMMPPLFEKNCLNKLQIFQFFHFKRICIVFLLNKKENSKQKSTLVIFP